MLKIAILLMKHRNPFNENRGKIAILLMKTGKNRNPFNELLTV